jgi:zinc protease
MRRLSTATLLVGLLGTAALSGFPAMAAAPAASTPAPAVHKLFDAKTFTLANGLQVVVVENHRVPVVSQMVWYKVGAADEPAGKSGIAHLFEHLMFKGTNTLQPKEFSRTVARHGGQDNAFTSSDYTAYYENIAVENLELVMGLEADRMRNLVLDEENVMTERAVVYEERLTRTENEPSALLSERLENALWVSHPYRNPVIGWPDELLALTRQDALDFYARWYAPNNAIVVISGDVTVDQVKALAEKVYGPLKRGPDISRKRPTTLPPAAEVRVELHHPQVTQPTWQKIYIAPSYATSKEPEQVYALQVLSELLGGGATSRLYRALVIDHKLAAAAGSFYRPQAVDWGTFGLYLTPRPGADLVAAEAAMKAEIDKLLTQEVSKEEVEEAKVRLRAGVIYARDSLQGAANTLGMALATGGTLDQVELWPQHIATVTRDQVMEAARAVLGGGSASAVGVLLPETQAPTSAPSNTGAPSNTSAQGDKQ